MDERRRDYFAEYLQRYKQFSEHRDPRTALIAGGTHILACASNDVIYEGSTYETSPIVAAILSWYKHHGAQNPYEDKTYLFSSYFPSMQDLLAILLTPIRSVYFFGDIDKEDAAILLNDHNRHGGLSQRIELIRLHV